MTAFVLLEKRSRRRRFRGLIGSATHPGDIALISSRGFSNYSHCLCPRIAKSPFREEKELERRCVSRYSPLVFRHISVWNFVDVALT